MAQTSNEELNELVKNLYKNLFGESFKVDEEVFSQISENTKLNTIIKKLYEDLEEDNFEEAQFTIIHLLDSLIEELTTHTLEPLADIPSLKQIRADFLKKLNILEAYRKSANKTKAGKIKHNIKESQALKKILQLLITYEIYKILNPRRIAGETKVTNFVHNVIIGGLKRASKYEGGKSKDLAKYSPKFINKLTNYHDQAKKNGFKGRI